MMSSKLWLPVLSALAITAGAGLASAQVVIQSDDRYYDDEDRPAVVYRDYGVDRDPDYRVRTYEYNLRPSGPNGCGTYHFWNGERCVDARYK